MFQNDMDRSRIGTLWLAMLLAVCVGVAPTLARAGESCPADPSLPHFELLHLKAALAAGREVVIVALGSSSTQGVRATNPGRTYPAALQDVLSTALPERHIAVINRGIGGQDAGAELSRIDSDVIAVRPQLVIWQVGANAALRDFDLVAFRRLVSEGVRRMESAGMDVVLMDNQRAPRLLARTEDGPIDHAMAEIAEDAGVGLFSRDHLMAAWQAEGAPATEFIAADGLHHNDRGYHCIARSLARAILASVIRPATIASSRR
jgi:acyl-CoA thioesterase I